MSLINLKLVGQWRSVYTGVKERLSWLIQIAVILCSIGKDHGAHRWFKVLIVASNIFFSVVMVVVFSVVGLS